MRVSELIGLNMDDIHLSMGFVRVFGKGGKERIIPLGGKAIKACKRYIEEARPVFIKKQKGADALICQYEGN